MNKMFLSAISATALMGAAYAQDTTNSETAGDQSRDAQDAMAADKAADGAASPSTNRSSERATANFSDEEVQHMVALLEITSQPIVQIGNYAILSPNAYTAERLIGKAVEGESGRVIGEVEDIVMGADGRIQSLVIETMGGLFRGEQEKAVDLEKARFVEGDDPLDRRVKLSLSDDELKALPRFEDDEARGVEISATDILDEEVAFAETAAGGVPVDGHVRDIVYGPLGEARYAVLGFGGVMGVGEDYSLIPYRTVRIAEGGESIYLNMAAQEIADTAAVFAYSVDEAMDPEKKKAAQKRRMEDDQADDTKDE